MTCYVISFEPRGEGAHRAIREQLKTLSSYCPINAYCWAVVTDMSAKELRDYIKDVSPESRLFVVRSGTEAAWRNGYGVSNSEWLKKHL
jgi:hypothetical protein